MLLTQHVLEIKCCQLRNSGIETKFCCSVTESNKKDKDVNQYSAVDCVGYSGVKDKGRGQFFDSSLRKSKFGWS